MLTRCHTKGSEKVRSVRIVFGIITHTSILNYTFKMQLRKIKLTQIVISQSISQSGAKDRCKL